MVVSYYYHGLSSIFFFYLFFLVWFYLFVYYRFNEIWLSSTRDAEQSNLSPYLFGQFIIRCSLSSYMYIYRYFRFLLILLPLIRTISSYYYCYKIWENVINTCCKISISKLVPPFFFVDPACVTSRFQLTILLYFKDQIIIVNADMAVAPF